MRPDDGEVTYLLGLCILACCVIVLLLAHAMGVL